MSLFPRRNSRNTDCEVQLNDIIAVLDVPTDNIEIVTDGLSCTDYVEEIEDCTAVDILDIKENGCEYYYEAETIGDEEYASACYCVVGTDACARNTNCEEIVSDAAAQETRFNDASDSDDLSCTDYVEEVDACTEVDIDDIKTNGCEYYYELLVINNKNYASACYCVVGTDSCARNDDCEELLETTLVSEIHDIATNSDGLSCTDYEVVVDDCTNVSIDEIKENGCEYYYELETISGVDYASACYCVVGTDSCARNTNCEEIVSDAAQGTRFSDASDSDELSCIDYVEEVET